MVAWNMRKLGQLTTRPVTILGSHAIIDERRGVVNRRRTVPRAAILKTADECGGLEAVVRLAVGARVMLRRNLFQEDGLVNGAHSEVVSFEWANNQAGPSDNNEQPAAVYVKFDNPAVGRLTNRATGSLAEGHRPVRIEAAHAQFQARAGMLTLQRTQFSLSLFWRFTIHKVQGLSMERAVIDLSNQSFFADAQAYVALSRVKTLDGVSLIGLGERALQKISPESIDGCFQNVRRPWLRDLQHLGSWQLKGLQQPGRRDVKLKTMMILTR
jgi:hypothetical protein